MPGNLTQLNEEVHIYIEGLKWLNIGQKVQSMLLHKHRILDIKQHLQDLGKGQNHSPCITGLPNIVLFCHPPGLLSQLHSAQMGKHLHLHNWEMFESAEWTSAHALGGMIMNTVIMFQNVRYHPLLPDILASGSLDQEVRLWDAKTSDCIGSQDFHRPIASIAFHARGEILAVASGHKLYIWNYNKRDEAAAPTIILRTRRSLRAVHFHPHGAPYLLTAEVNNLDSADSPLTLATSSGYSNYPSAVFFANINSRNCPHHEANSSSPCLLWPAYLRDDGSLCLIRNDLVSSSTNVHQRPSSLAQNPLLASDVENQQPDQLVTPMDVCPGEPSTSHASASGLSGVEMQIDRGQPSSRLLGSSSTSNHESSTARDDVQMPSLSNSVPIPATSQPSEHDGRHGMPMNSFTTSSGLDVHMILRNSEGGNHHHDLFSDSRSWELPFLQGWFMAQNHTGASPSIPIDVGSSRGSNRHHASRRHVVGSLRGVGSSLLGPQIDEAEVHAASLGVGSELTTSLLAAGAAELPCTVKLRIWRHDIKDPCVTLEPEACRLTISHAVLCSEMGAHFSPCGRFLVACVACLLPQTEGDRGSQLPVQYDSAGAGTSPTRHPLPSHRVIYELRVYSLEEATFGKVLTSRAIRAAHCLTSIQFSPTSEHILLAYGRRHNSMLRSIVMDGETGIPVYTILEEGKLRILQHNGADTTSTGFRDMRWKAERLVAMCYVYFSRSVQRELEDVNQHNHVAAVNLLDGGAWSTSDPLSGGGAPPLSARGLPWPHPQRRSSAGGVPNTTPPDRAPPPPSAGEHDGARRRLGSRTPRVERERVDAG
uniref:Uncharacterized protein n=1 Tax=Oryza barthii TaxID=65489 RepID=A0A0D3F3U5_9ORYZ